MPALNVVLQSEAEKRVNASLQRAAMPGNEQGAVLTRDGRDYVSFGGNDYLGLRQHPLLVRAAQKALEEHGAGAGASRLITGTHPLYELLEARLAQSKQAEAALAFGSGYATSIGTIPALVGKDDVIFADKLSHACMLDGAMLSGAKLVRFAHNDMDHLQQLLKAQRGNYKNALIMTERIFSMDGDQADIDALVRIKQEHDAWLLIDDAHGLGTLPTSTIGDVDVWMGTLSKAAGSYGGYIIGSAALREHVLNTARSFIFSTGLPPAVVAASAEALRVMADEPRHREALWGNIHYLATRLDMPTPQSAVMPLLIGDDANALRAQAALMDEGYFVPAIRPPTVPPGTARLRVSLSALHTKEHIDGLVSQLQKAGCV